jgi:DNA-binding NarL/FixJ family response regulator
MNMAKKVLLVGHCGPDGSYLRSAVRAATTEAQVASADDLASLETALQGGVDLALINRVLEFGFHHSSGIDLIRALKKEHPQTRFMLVSNYAEAQAAAQQAGALPGFGKRDIGSALANIAIKNALA